MTSRSGSALVGSTPASPLLAGAADYIAKPFSARELIRVALPDALRPLADPLALESVACRGRLATGSSATSIPMTSGGCCRPCGEAIAAKRMFELEHRVRRADGSLGWTLSRAVPILDAAGEVVKWFGAASDVTGRRETDPVLAAPK